jgi:hypothetical protein
MKTTPTTKILAIGTINPGFEQSQVFAVLPEEVRETVVLIPLDVAHDSGVISPTVPI